MIVTFEGELWMWDARRGDSWYFVTVPPEPSEDIREVTEGRARGFGSLRVRATVGATTWSTSIFPDSGRGGYALPVKRAVRTAEHLDAGDPATVTIELVDV